MEILKNVGIHNRFDIEVKNIETGGVNHFKAENLITDSMWDVLCAGGKYFDNIAFGSGSGIPTPERKTLFSALGTKSASNTEIIKAVPVSSWKRQIVLGLTEYVDATITEVGIGTTSTIYTHAMLQDGEGNPVSISKTNLDIVTIYATVFVTIGGDGVELLGLPNSNILLNYLIGGVTFSSVSFSLGRIGARSNSTSIGSSFIIDRPNKKRKTNIARLGASVNYPYADLLDVFNLFRLPLNSITGFIGHPFTNILLGVGNGNRKIWEIPSTNIKEINVSVNGVPNLDFGILPWGTGEYQLLADPSILPNGISRGVALTSDGTMMAVAHTDYPYITTYDWTEDTWVKRPNPSILPTSNGRSNGVALTPDGTVMAVATNTSPFITTYDWTEGTWVKRPDPSILPTDSSYGVALTPDGTVMAVGHNRSPYITTYDWTEDTWVKRPNPSILPTNSGNGVTLTPDGNMMAVAHDGSPYIATYDWTEGTWVKRPNPSILPTSYSYGVALTPDGTAMAVAHSSSPYITTYDWTEDTWVKRPNPSILPTGGGYGVALTPDGTMMAVVHYGSPYITTYDWTEDTWVKRPDPSILPNKDYGYGVALTPDGTVMAMAHDRSPYITTYDNRGIKITFNNPPPEGHEITANYVVDGIHKTSDFVVDVSCAIQFGEVM